MHWLRYAVGGTILAGLAAGYARFIEPHWIETRRVALPIRHLAPEFEGYHLVQISDLHADQFMTAAWLGHIVARVNALKPDLIVITGDYVTDSHLHALPAFLPAALKGLRAVDGVYGIVGNHDYYGDVTDSQSVMAQGNVCNLSNAVHTVRRGAGVLHIAGLDSAVYQNARLDVVLAALPDDDTPAILLAHEPDVADFSATTGRFALQVSGHTHGGQVRLPFVGMVWWPFHGRRYEQGLYRVREMWLYVNRGLGMVDVPLRFNCRPEITVFTLHDAARFERNVAYQLPAR